MTSGLPSKRPSVGREASGFGGQPMLSVMDESKVYAREGEDIVIEKKTAPMANKTEEKGGMSMGPMVTSGWKSMDYSAPVEETILHWWVNLWACWRPPQGFRTPNCWGRPDEIGSPTTIF